jgi:poly(hydroxyalkanoate) depolymerase family esterase
MTFSRLQGMTDALRLTRAGQLNQATQLLQSLCEAPQAAAPTEGQHRDGDILDLEPQQDGASLSWALPSAPAAGRAGNNRPSFKPSSAAGFAKAFEGLAGGISARPAVNPTLPPGAQFLSLTFNGKAGGRAYRLYVPASYRGAPAPLIVMLHGCTQSPEDFAAGTGMNALAEIEGCLVAYPAQPASANPQKCWNWFSAGDQLRDQGEPAVIAGLTRQIMQEYAIDVRRVYVAGLSAGGAAAAILGAAYPDLYAAIGVHSGLACGAARDMPSAFAAMRQGGAAPSQISAGMRKPPAIVFHADRDGTVHPRNGEQVLAQFGAGPELQVEVRDGQVPGGHRYQVSLHRTTAGEAVLEHWLVRGGGHAWAGGQAAGSYTDPRGPDASREMLRFFLQHSLPLTKDEP